MHACDALKCGTATKIILDAAFSTGILMAEDDEREREWEKVDPKDAPDPDADPANLLQAPGPYPIAWEASECALEMVATFLMSASGMTQHFYRSALGTSKSKGRSRDRDRSGSRDSERGETR